VIDFKNARGKPEINQNNVYKIRSLTEDALSQWQRPLFRAI